MSERWWVIEDGDLVRMMERCFGGEAPRKVHAEELVASSRTQVQPFEDAKVTIRALCVEMGVGANIMEQALANRDQVVDDMERWISRARHIAETQSSDSTTEDR